MRRAKKQGDEGVERVAFTTNIDKELLKLLKIYCAKEDLYQNEVIEKLLGDLLLKEGDKVGDTN